MSANGVIICSRCEEKYSAKRHQCPSCRQWRTAPAGIAADKRIIRLSEVEDTPEETRLLTGPWDYCFGGEKTPGIVRTSVTIIGGSPGAGKSTMSLQLTDCVATALQKDILYIATEQSSGEIKASAKRLGLANFDKIMLVPMGVDFNLGMLAGVKPAAVILDSLPGLTGDHAVAVLVCKQLKLFAVQNKAPVVVIDHVTKGDDFAGFMSLQHEVDTLLTSLSEGNWTPVSSLR